jgi:hypothetical protein
MLLYYGHYLLVLVEQPTYERLGWFKLSVTLSPRLSELKTMVLCIT